MSQCPLKQLHQSFLSDPNTGRKVKCRNGRRLITISVTHAGPQQSTILLKITQLHNHGWCFGGTKFLALSDSQVGYTQVKWKLINLGGGPN